jgi:DNA repair exonuclease SbcCD ATPase subunit
MSELKDLKDKLGRLEVRVNEISGQIAKVLETVQNLQKQYAQSEIIRDGDESTRKKSEWLLFRFGLMMGSLSGVITGLMVAYLMKLYEGIYIASWIWGISTTGLFIIYGIMLYSIWRMKRPSAIL